MAKNLVIVESPAKAKTIEKFLGKDFKVESSYGHIADLPSKEIGVDVEQTFTPKYQVSSDKVSLVNKLKTLADKAEIVWLASDEDREGEAIAWHLAEQLSLDKVKTKRIVFNSITKKAILKAIENPRSINYDLVDAQQARRVLDRIVGYELSPVLWRKVRQGLSAGRVQSVAVRLIVERERAIAKFKAVASYRVDAEFVNLGGKKFRAKLPKNFNTREEAQQFLSSCLHADFNVKEIQKKPAKKKPAAPFTTSTLQQEASRKLGFSVSRTMQVAQRLYEQGIITYMRTDSVNLSDEALEASKAEIESCYGDSYSMIRNYATKSKGAQEAHEAVRPTDMARHSINIDIDQDKLYSLIWKRTIASQMSDAQLERTNVKIQNNVNQKLFVANGQVIKFDGFLKVYLEGTDDETEEDSGMLPKISVNEVLENKFITATERYTRPPSRFTEASLVKRLEELGIGRPSTYAPTISTIQKRKYIVKGIADGNERSYLQLLLKSGNIFENNLLEKVGADKGKLMPTDIGNVVNDFLVEHFDTVLDFGFTAKVESDFDEVAAGKEDWKSIIKGFYHKFHPKVKDVAENADRASGQRLLGIEPQTGKNVYVRLGKFGPMVQIGEVDDDEKPRFASLQIGQTLDNLTYEQAIDLFELPKTLGLYEDLEVVVSNGRYGPYIKFDKMYVSLDKGENPMDVNLDRGIELIEAKRRADAPIGYYEDKPIQKGIGRFGPFIKWNSIFININKKYDFDNLTQEDLETLIEEKKQKERDKLIHDWSDIGIRVEKARWGRFNVIKDKIKVELPKTTLIQELTKDEAIKLIEAKTPKKKVKKKTTKKTVKKK